MNEHELCDFRLEYERARNELEWLRFLLDIDYVIKNKLELFCEPD